MFGETYRFFTFMLSQGTIFLPFIYITHCPILPDPFEEKRERIKERKIKPSTHGNDRSHPREWDFQSDGYCFFYIYIYICSIFYLFLCEAQRVRACMCVRAYGCMLISLFFSQIDVVRRSNNPPPGVL